VRAGRNRQCNAAFSVRLDEYMTPDENAPLTVDLTIQEAVGIIGDLRHMIRLNRATSQEEEAAWGRARPAVMRKLTRAMEGVSRKLAELPDADWPRLGNVWRAAGSSRPPWSGESVRSSRHSRCRRY
jgi:hypothetical protein